MNNFGKSGLSVAAAVSLIALVLFASVGAFAAEARRVLPLKVIGDGLGDGQAEQFTQAIIKKLIKYPDVRLMPVPVDDPLDIMLEAGCEDLDDACLIAIGESARADEVVLVEVSIKKGRCVVAAKHVVVAGGASSSPETVGNSEDQIGAMLVDTVEKIFGPEPEPEPVLAPVVEDVMFSVITSPAGADIYIDDDFSGMTPRAVYIKPGDHVIRVKKSGYIEKSQNVTVDIVNMTGVEWKLEPVAKPVVVAPVVAPAAAPVATPAPVVAPAPVAAPAPVVAAKPVAAPVVAPAPVAAPAPVVAAKPVAAPVVAPAPVAVQAPAVTSPLDVPPIEDGVPEEPESEVKKDPFYKTWWFWTIVGVAVVGAGTVAGILASQGDAQDGIVEFSPWGNYAPLDVTLYPRPN